MNRTRAILMALVLTLIAARCAHGQEVGAAIGAYHAPSGHPAIHFAGSLRAEYSGVGLEFMHAATIEDRRPLDLFAYRLTFRQRFGGGEITPFVSAGLGYGLWRKWVCLNGSCGAAATGPTIDADKFSFHRGASGFVGVGIQDGVMRADLRAEWSQFRGVDATLWLGVHIG